MPMDLPTAIQLGQFVNAAYSPSSTTPLTYAPPLGYQVVQPIYGNDLATDISSGPDDAVPFGFIAQSPAGVAPQIVVAIRGTEGIWEWVQDARFNRVTCPFAAGAGTTDDGFTDVYMSLTTGSPSGPRVVSALAPLLKAAPTATLTITGHSLGSALATLLALDVVEQGVTDTPAVTTFASPLVGDGQFAATYNSELPNTWRIANAVDIVPKLPPPNWGFVHVNTLFSVSSLGKAKLNPVCCHAMDTYLYLLDQLNGGSTLKLDASCVGLI